MAIEMIHSIWTLLLAVIFIGIVAWAWSGRIKKRFETAARSVLEEEKSGSNTTHRSACARGAGESGDLKEGCCGGCTGAESKHQPPFVPSRAKGKEKHG